MVFNVEQSVRPEDIDDPRDLSQSRGEAIFDDFINRLEGWGKGALAISKSPFFGSRGELGRARKIVEDVWMKCSDQPLVMQFRPTIERVLSRAEKEGTRYDAEQIAGKTGR
jgi:hypothetical protein